MSRPSSEAVYQWTQEVASPLPPLSRPQAAVLALGSLGRVLARSGALTAVAGFWAAWQERPANTVRQQRRECCYAAADKRGPRRRALVVAACFVPLLRWAVAGYAGPRLALALDATHLGDRFVVRAISVVYRGCAIPVAWTVVRAAEKHAWRREWRRMLRLPRPAPPRGWTVIVLADRGLSARGLYRRGVRLGWHPFLRVNLGGTFCPAGQSEFRPLSRFAPEPGRRWAGRGVALKTRDRQLACTLLAAWAEGDAAPWLILTDRPPEAAAAGWYGLRAWIEQGFKVTKRAGGQWQRPRMTDPERAARLWLAVAVATLWLLRVGGAAEAAIPEGTLLDVTAPLSRPRRQRRATQLRRVSVFRPGWLAILMAVRRPEPLPRGAFVPEPWPTLAGRLGPAREEAVTVEAA